MITKSFKARLTLRHASICRGGFTSPVERYRQVVCVRHNHIVRMTRTSTAKPLILICALLRRCTQAEH